MDSNVLIEAGKSLGKALLANIKENKLDPGKCLVQVSYDHNAPEDSYGWRANTINTTPVCSNFVHVNKTLVSIPHLDDVTRMIEHIINNMLEEARLPFIKNDVR